MRRNIFDSRSLEARGQALISALSKISGRMEVVPPQAKAKVEPEMLLYYSGTLGKHYHGTLLHPPALEKRIAALEKIENELRGY